MKPEGCATLLGTIRSLLDGKIQVSEQMSGRILEAFSSPAPTKKTGVAGLSDREFEVFELLGIGLTTHKIAKHLHLSPKTVDAHRTNVKDKLHVTKMPELIAGTTNWVASQRP